MEVLLLVFLILVIHPGRSSDSVESNKITEAQKAEELYKKLYKHARAEQVEVIKNLRKLNLNKLNDMILLMGEKIFSVILESRARIEASPYIPGVSEFPLDEKIRDALSNILENTALFSGITLRFPDISGSLLKANNNWDVLLQWGIAFCHQVKYLLDNSTIKLLSLVSQELNYVPRDPTYFNPYSSSNREKMNQEQTTTAKSKKKKREIKKGPHLSRWGEL